MYLRAAKQSAIAFRRAFGGVLPSSIRRRLPPPERRSLSLDEILRRPGVSGTRVLYHSPVESRTRPKEPIGYGGRLAAFRDQLTVPAHDLFVISIRNARSSGIFPAIVSEDWRLVECVSQVHAEPIETHPTFTFAVLPRPLRLSGKTLLLAGPWGSKFYHWLIDQLPRLEIVSRANFALDEFDHVIVSPAGGPFVSETISRWPSLLGKLRVLDNATHYDCEELICPSFPHKTLYSDTWSPAFVRRALLQRERSDFGSSLIYISRRSAPRRRVRNEEQIINEVLEPMGFRSYELESMTMLEQMELISTARCVVAAHGAGLTNLIFAPAECTVVELLSTDYPLSCFWHLAVDLQLDYRYAVARPSCNDVSSEPFKDIEVDPATLRDAVHSILAADNRTVGWSKHSA